MRKPFFKPREGEPTFSKDVFIINIFDRHLTTALARFCVWSGISANIVTFFTFIVTFVTGFLFATNHLILGAVFFYLRLALDSTDGKIARLTRTTSKFGKNLDYISDTTSVVVMFAGVWWSQYYLQGEWFLGTFWIGLHYLVVFVGFLFVERFTYETRFSWLHSYYTPFEELWLIFLIGGLFNIIKIMIPIAIGLQIVNYSILVIKKGKRLDVKKRLKNMFLNIRG